MLAERPIVINFSGDAVSTIVDILMLLLTVGSVICAFRAYKHQKDRSKKEAACNLAKYYASSIIDKYADVTTVFNVAGVTEILRGAFEIRDLQDFDKEELERLLKNSKINVDEFGKKLREIDPAVILKAKMYRACSADERGRTFENYTKVDKGGKIEIINGIYLQQEFTQEVFALLNELEWFAMNCKYGIADEELLYQSLHQTFLSTVWMLYFFISDRNINNEDKLFTNIIWLFTKWRNRLTEITDNIAAEKQEYINKANAVKAKAYEGTSLK